MPDESLEITGDTDAWFQALEAGTFAQAYQRTEQAIAAETAKAHADLHRETRPGAVPWGTPPSPRPSLEASDH